MKEFKEILDPKNILVDDRSISDYIILLKKLSNLYNYYNNKNKINGNFSGLLETDESFLISEISKYPIGEFDKARLNLIARFDQSASEKVKSDVFKNYLKLTAKMFNCVNDWHTSSKKNNLNKKSSKIESAIEIAIESRLAEAFYHFQFYLDFFNSKKLIEDFGEINIENFNSIIWNFNAKDKVEEIFDYSDNEELLSNSLKKIILISSEVFETIFNLKIKSKKFLDESLYHNNNHKAHIGLLFSFLKLFQYTQIDINSFSEKHLDFYYKKILKQKLISTQPVNTYITIDIEENSNEITLSNENFLVAGQYFDGAPVRLKMLDDVKLNNIKISEILTVFVSRNPIFDFKSKYQLVSAIYFKSIADSIDAVSKFNSNETTFSTLGRDQNFLTSTEMTMKFAKIGFLISSPVLKLGSSNRKIIIDLNFTVGSISYLSDLIIDISNNTDLNEEEVFSRIFNNAFELSYTCEEGWYNILNYEVLAPEDWTTGTIRIGINLNKLDPSFIGFDEDLHKLNLDINHPLLRVDLSQKNFYNSYSFLSTLELQKIDIKVEVRDLKKIKIFREGQLVDNNSDFDLFGPLAKYGSVFYLGCEELFNKKVSDFSLQWEYSNLPPKCKNIADYYAAYNQNFKNDSFKVKISALSDFNFNESDSEDFNFNLFEANQVNELINSRRVSFGDLTPLKIKPNYQINSDYLNEFSNDIETGLFKLEMTSPLDGFGFDLYPKLYSDSIASQFDKKKKTEKENLPELNEPFAPKINNLRIDYKAKTSIVFKDSENFENDFLEENTFHQISPFGIEKTFSKDGIASKNLFHNFFNEGELVIGLESKKSFTGLNILFEIIKSENTNYEFSRKIVWYYSSFDGWKKMGNDNILFDQTYNLMRTGIISFRFPDDFSRSKKILNPQKYYLKACSEDQADQFSLIKSIKTNAIMVKEVLAPNAKNRIEKLKANSVEGFEKKIHGVLTVNQPFNSGSFKIKERKIDFYQRVSELLRHKNRPVTKWDIERFILNRFDWLSHVSCFNYNEKSSKINLKILCLKRIEIFQNIEEVKLSVAEMNQIKSNVSEFLSPFYQIEIVNPIFEDLWIKCKLRFRDIPIGKGIEKLNVDLLDFICKWRRVDIDTPKIIVNRIKKYDIIKFIKERNYIAFVTGISIIHFKQSEDGSIYAYDSAAENENSEFIECGSKWSIIVPRDNHKIEILSKDEYHSPEPTNFSELGINKSFLIVKKSEEKLIENSYVGKNTKENINNLQFEIKI